MHVSRLKPCLEAPTRPVDPLPEVAEDDDFDTALLPEDSWEADETAGEYEVETLLDVRWVKRTRHAKRTKEYLVKWKGEQYPEPEWIPVHRLNCGALLFAFDQGARARARFQAMQAGEAGEDPESPMADA